MLGYHFPKISFIMCLLCARHGSRHFLIISRDHMGQTQFPTLLYIVRRKLKHRMSLSILVCHHEWSRTILGCLVLDTELVVTYWLLSVHVLSA